MNVLVDSADPVGRPLVRRELDDGLVLEQVRVPIGVLLIVFESRPDAVIQIGSLALRTGNAVLMKGGSEALHSNRALTDLLRDAVVKAGGPADVVQNVEGREAVADLLAMDEHIDLVVPRGSADLVRAIKAASRIPVLGHADGICHVYVDAAADPGMAVRVAVDSKTNYVAVCNAAETLLLHRDFQAGPAVVQALLDAGVDVRGDEVVEAMAPGVTAARPSDFGHEFGDLTIAARVVDGVDEAIDHIHAYGSAHTDTVVTEDAEVAGRFLETVDFVLGVLERQHPVRRRVPLRVGGRGGYRHGPCPRPGSDGGGRTVHHQVGTAGRWARGGRLRAGQAVLHPPGPGARLTPGYSTSRISVSATQAGLADPSSSIVTFSSRRMPLGFSDTPAISRTTRTLEPTGTGLRNRTRLRP